MPLEEARLTRAVTALELHDLKLRYAALCDAGYDGAALARLFTEDAVWDGGEAFGRHEGRAAIQTFFSGLGAEIAWALHFMIGPRITELSEDGTRAAASWYLWMPYVVLADGGAAPMLLTARQHDRYRRLEGSWRFERIDVVVETRGPMEEGWRPAAGAPGHHAAA